MKITFEGTAKDVPTQSTIESLIEKKCSKPDYFKNKRAEIEKQKKEKEAENKFQMEFTEKNDSMKKSSEKVRLRKILPERREEI